ncbi:MAG: PBP1A family penicillin-binding protein [Myxococcota bacterium]
MSRSRSRGVRVLLGLVVVLGFSGAVTAGVVYWTLLRDLPDFHSLADYQPPLATRVLDRDGRVIGEFFERRRQLVRMQEIPEHVILAFVAGEDDAFFRHSGLDYVAILRAAWVDILAGEKRQGASTITMQTAKNLLLTSDRSFRRKIKEMILARRIEERFSKDEILFLYLNEIYFGSGAYGVAEAARTYFDKRVGELSISEAALLAGLPKAPSKYSPFSNMEAAEDRRQYVLEQMQDAGFIDEEAYEETLVDLPVVKRPEEYSDFAAAAYFTEQVRRALFDALGGEQVLTGGLVVHTTLDLDLQQAAVRAVRGGLETLDHRQGYRGPLRQLETSQLEGEIERVGAENRLPGTGEAQEKELAWPAPFDPEGEVRPLVGVVTGVDRKAQTAEIAFAPGLRASVELSDVSWAREPNPSSFPTPVRSIGAVFDVGDVARFVATSRSSNKGGDDTGPVHLTLYQEPLVEGALLSLEVETGDVLALVGGYDFERSEFDRTMQARRQPGSSFKPIIYASALENGYTGASIIYDRPLVYTDEESGFTWKPQNYGRRFLGPLTLREALTRSVNNATIHLLKDVGVSRVAALAEELGIASPLERNLSLALGASPISLFELSRAYAAFPSGGELVIPTFIRRVEDAEGEPLLLDVPLDESDRVDLAPSEPEGPMEVEVDEAFVDEEVLAESVDGRPMSETDAYLTVELLRAVVHDPRGTGRRAQSLGRSLAGKTGTTNDQGDAWFMGFSPDVLTGVWVGFDEKRLLGKGETGGRAALPIWIDFMREALRDRPVRDFPVPDGIVVVRIDRSTGLLADASSQDVFFQAFAEGTEPTETASTALSSAESRRRLRLEF